MTETRIWKHDYEFAEQHGIGVRWLREKILDVTPGACLLKGRQRLLYPHHEKVVLKAWEALSCRSNSSRRANAGTRHTMRAAPSRDDALSKAYRLATGR